MASLCVSIANASSDARHIVLCVLLWVSTLLPLVACVLCFAWSSDHFPYVSGVPQYMRDPSTQCKAWPVDLMLVPSPPSAFAAIPACARDNPITATPRHHC
eukprot:1525655-Amphidinium_carterae.2